ncbi:MFS transporter [Acerihabitans arboris]|uniref:MFS transporter n=1 Tax=Acerihabitans arboris TaxID=2691583 RepID=A0A845SFU0_9GAMM|nr:MFS transporter [Acerihabitans arboris]NDL61491.1 MFS transporter [Acerihabitans arboris]
MGTLDEIPLARREDIISHACGKFFKRIIPMLVIMLIVNQIDRSNIGFIKAELAADAGVGAAAFGLGAGLFFVGYALFEVPSNIFLGRYGARVWLTRIMITWGLVVFCTAFITSATQFYVMRFLLGVAEAGFFPGILYYFRQWVPNAWRGRATAMILSASAAAFLFSGPITGGILGLHDVLGIPGWKWVLFLEGGMSVAIGFVAYFILVSSPRQAKWLTPQESELLLAQLAREDEERNKTITQTSRLKLLFDRQMLFYCTLFFTMTMTGYTLVFWLPQIIRRIHGFSDFGIGLLTAIPWLCAIIAINLVGKISDRFRHMLDKVLALAMLLAAFGTFLATLGNPWFGFVAMCIACVGSKTSATFFWPMPQGNLPASIVAPGIALINSVGNLGGFFAPAVFGYLEQKTGSTTGGLYALTCVSVVAAVYLLCRNLNGIKPPNAMERKNV